MQRSAYSLKVTLARNLNFPGNEKNQLISIFQSPTEAIYAIPSPSLPSGGNWKVVLKPHYAFVDQTTLQFTVYLLPKFSISTKQL